MRFLIPLLLLLAACSPAATAVQQVDDPLTDPVEISVSLYAVRSPEGSPFLSSSQRTVAELEGIFTKMQGIWSQAGVRLTLSNAAAITAPESVLRDLARGTTSTFFDAASTGALSIPDGGTLLGFYVKEIGSVNGMAPMGTRVFFVADDPSVNDERVSSHEIGHILGLSHNLENAERLMFSGTNGTDLTDEESSVARSRATLILDETR